MLERYVHYISVGLTVVTGATRGIAFANEAFASMHGYELGELSAMSADELIAAEFREEWHAAIEGAQHPEHSLALEIDLLRKDGSTFPALVRVTAISDGTELKYLIEVHDREASNKLLRALNEDRTLLLATLEQLSVPMALLDSTSYQPLMCSRGLFRLFPDPSIITDAALENALRAIAEAVRHRSTGSPSQRIVVSASTSGLASSVAVEETPILDALGQQIGIIALLQAVETGT